MTETTEKKEITMHSYSGRISFSAELVLDVDQHAAPLPGSWFISHQLGGPARHTYTEVAFVTDGTPGADHLDRDALEEIVRSVAVELYERKWSFIYESADRIGIERHDLKRRERVVVTDIFTLEV